MIIAYTVKKVDVYGHSTIIELCGEFRDWEHFKAFQKNEESRGWKVITMKVVKE